LTNRAVDEKHSSLITTAPLRDGGMIDALIGLPQRHCGKECTPSKRSSLGESLKRFETGGLRGSGMTDGAQHPFGGVVPKTLFSR